MYGFEVYFMLHRLELFSTTITVTVKLPLGALCFLLFYKLKPFTRTLRNTDYEVSIPKYLCKSYHFVNQWQLLLTLLHMTLYMYYEVTAFKLYKKTFVKGEAFYRFCLTFLRDF